MSAASEKSSVEFTECGAIYRPGNGHVIEYRNIGNIYYHVAHARCRGAGAGAGPVQPPACPHLLRRHDNRTKLA